MMRMRERSMPIAANSTCRSLCNPNRPNHVEQCGSSGMLAYAKRILCMYRGKCTPCIGKNIYSF